MSGKRKRRLGEANTSTCAGPDAVDAAEGNGHAATARYKLALQVVQPRAAPLNLQQPRSFLQPPSSFLHAPDATISLTRDLSFESLETLYQFCGPRLLLPSIPLYGALM